MVLTAREVMRQQGCTAVHPYSEMPAAGIFLPCKVSAAHLALRVTRYRLTSIIPHIVGRCRGSVAGSAGNHNVFTKESPNLSARESRHTPNVTLPSASLQFLSQLLHPSRIAASS